MAKQIQKTDSGSRPLERYLRVLDAVSAARDGISAMELTQALNLPRTTVDRLLNALTASELVTAETARASKYRLGTRLLRIIQSDDEWLRGVSKQILKELAAETNQTSFIAKFEGAHVRSIAMESPDASVGIYVIPGHSIPLHAGATGKLLTAMQDEDIRDKILPSELTGYTVNTITKLPTLLKELAKIRSQGYALDRGEQVQGLSTIACPVVLPDRSLGSYAVAVTGMSDHFNSAAIKRFLPILQAAASQFAACLLLPQRRV